MTKQITEKCISSNNTKVYISENFDTIEPELNKTQEGEIFLYNYKNKLKN